MLWENFLGLKVREVTEKLTLWVIQFLLMSSSIIYGFLLCHTTLLFSSTKPPHDNNCENNEPHNLPHIEKFIEKILYWLELIYNYDRKTVSYTTKSEYSRCNCM